MSKKKNKNWDLIPPLRFQKGSCLPKMIGSHLWFSSQNCGPRVALAGTTQTVQAGPSAPPVFLTQHLAKRLKLFLSCSCSFPGHD